MTSVHPGPFSFGRAPIGGLTRPTWVADGDSADDADSDDAADYDDPTVVAANLERALRAARVRLTGRPRRR